MAYQVARDMPDLQGKTNKAVRRKRRQDGIVHEKIDYPGFKWS